MATYEDRALTALGNATRRAIFERLGRGPSSVGELARELPVSRPAVSQHLKVLKQAGLVVDRPVGNRRFYRLRPQGIGALEAYFHRFWSHALAEFQKATERGGTMMQPITEADVRVTVRVAAPIERAFQVFTERCDAWWPRQYRLGQAARIDLVLEPRAGGRWYERSADGKECDWGKVLLWDPPRRLTLSWQIGVGFVPEPDAQRASRVEVTFVEDGPARTIVTVSHSEFHRHGEGWESMRDGVSGDGGWPGILQAYAELAAAGSGA